MLTFTINGVNFSQTQSGIYMADSVQPGGYLNYIKVNPGKLTNDRTSTHATITRAAEFDTANGSGITVRAPMQIITQVYLPNSQEVSALDGMLSEVSDILTAENLRYILLGGK